MKVVGVLFLSLFVIVVSASYTSSTNLLISCPVVSIGILLVLTLLLFPLVKPWIIVPSSSWVVIERIGGPLAVKQPGLHFIRWPLEWPARVWWTRSKSPPFTGPCLPQSQICFDPPSWAMTLVDNTQVEVDVVFFIQIVDVIQAVTKIDDLYKSVESSALTSTVDVICHYTLQQTQQCREEIRGKIMKLTDEKVMGWGVKMVRIEIEGVHHPASIRKVIESIEGDTLCQQSEVGKQQRQQQAQLSQARHDQTVQAITLATRAAEHQAEVDRTKLRWASESEGKVQTYRKYRDAGATDAYLTTLVQTEAWVELGKTAGGQSLAPLLPMVQALASMMQAVKPGVTVDLRGSDLVHDGGTDKATIDGDWTH